MMSEKKGLFGRLFGRKEKPAKEAAAERLEERAQEVEAPLRKEDPAPDLPKQSDAPTTDVPDSILDHIRPDEGDEISEGQVEDVLKAPAFEEEQVASQPEAKEEPKPEPIIEQTPAPQPVAQPTQDKAGIFARLREGLSRTSSKLTEGVTGIFAKRKLDDTTLEELEDLLITADLGVNAAMQITQSLAKDKFDKEISGEEVRNVLADEVSEILERHEKPLTINTDHKPHVILMTGVNGAGKTTTIGKLALRLKNRGHSVMFAAGDTFRAAAVEQLSVWGERVGAEVIKRDVGADAAGLAFDAMKEAQKRGVDVLMIDTAGRLQNKKELMDELAKVVRVIKKVNPSAPHDSLLVLDATVGQNALSQAEAFLDSAGVTGLIMTKLDGTARGGVLVALADKFGIPIHMIGVGEQVEDLQVFSAYDFARALSGLDV